MHLKKPIQEANELCACSFFKSYVNGSLLIFYGNDSFLAAGPAKPERHRGFLQTEHLRCGILRPITGTSLNRPTRAFAPARVKHAQLDSHAVGVGRWAMENDAKPRLCAPVRVQLGRSVV